MQFSGIKFDGECLNVVFIMHDDRIEMIIS